MTTIKSRHNRIFKYFILLFIFPLSISAQSPAGFSDILYSSAYNEPVGITYDENGVMYVWERGGRVYVMENDTKRALPLIDISHEVGAWRDFGMLGFTLDPDYLTNGRIYLFYVVDRHHLLNFQDVNNDGKDDDDNYSYTTDEYLNATIGRITRYVVTNPFDPGIAVADTTTRTILFGENPNEGNAVLHLSHGVGSIMFGQDGSLLASTGDGSSYNVVDGGGPEDTYSVQGLADGIITAQEDVGSFRSQMLSSYNGKILRINPETGAGYPSNPFYDGNINSKQSKVYILGLRNPFRFTLKPNTGSHNVEDGLPGVLFIGDVGWNGVEDMHVLADGGHNCGWPLYQGNRPHNGYNREGTYNMEAPTPVGCPDPYYKFSDLINQDESNSGLPVTFPDTACTVGGFIDGNTYNLYKHRKPEFSWFHNLDRTNYSLDNEVHIALESNGAIPGSIFRGEASIGGTWIDFDSWPPEWQNYYIHADYGKKWLRFMGFNATTHKPTEVIDDYFATVGNPVFVGVDTIRERLFYITWQNEIREIVYSGNKFPTAVAVSDTTYGPGPLSVQFDGSQSSDPESGTLTYLWNFGDNTTSTEINPTHIYTPGSLTPTEYTVSLTVTDDQGQQDQTFITISINNTPPVIQSTSLDNVDYYSLASATTLNLSAVVTDAEHTNNELTYCWQTFLYHENHNHSEPLDCSETTTTTIDPLGCDGIIYYYGIVLTVKDQAGLSTTYEKFIYPDCGFPQAIHDFYDYQDGGAITIEALANDVSSIEFDSTTMTIQRSPAHGATSIDPVTGTITYTHNGDGSTTDDFTYTVDDKMGNQSNTATVNLSLTGPPTVIINTPSDGNKIYDDEIFVSFASFGDLSLADHVHLTLDNRPHETMSSVIGSYTFTDLHPGYHTIKAQLATSDHMLLSNSEATFEIEVLLLDETPCVSNGLIALYDFNDGSGTVVKDVSGVASSLDLNIVDPLKTSWVSGGGLMVTDTTKLSSNGSASQLINQIKATNAFTIEIWAEPANTNLTGPARILTLSDGNDNRNLLLGQSLDEYAVRLRTTSGGDNNGLPELVTTNSTAQTALQHIVYTRDASGNLNVYVNGVSKISDVRAGDLSNWDDTYALTIASEPTDTTIWMGTLYKIAIYDLAFTAPEVSQVYADGVDCFSSCNIDVSNVSSVRPTFCSLTDGSINISATGTDLLYSIDNGQTFQASNEFSNLSPGTYPIVVKESSDENCAISTSATLVDYSISAHNLVVSARVFLQGAFNGTDMNTDLLTQGVIPLSQPYNTSPWNYSGTECVNTIPNDVVDWVLIQIRSSTDASAVIAERACFVRKDGMLIDLDGGTSINFGHIMGVTNGYIAVKHRNHADVMTIGPISLN